MNDDIMNDDIILMEPAEYPPEVAKAIEAMDEIRPGWALKIDLGTFDIQSDSCIFGQLDDQKTRRMDSTSRITAPFGFGPNDFPFNSDVDEPTGTLQEDLAQRAWYSEIHRRQQTATSVSP